MQKHKLRVTEVEVRGLNDCSSDSVRHNIVMASANPPVLDGAGAGAGGDENFQPVPAVIIEQEKKSKHGGKTKYIKYQGANFRKKDRDYWYCEDYWKKMDRCHARLTVKENVIVSAKVEHNHDVDLIYSFVESKVAETIKNNVETNTAPRVIYADLCSRLQESTAGRTATEYLDGLDKFSRRLNNARKKSDNLPKQPQFWSELEQIPSVFTKSYSENNFFSVTNKWMKTIPRAHVLSVLHPAALCHN